MAQRTPISRTSAEKMAHVDIMLRTQPATGNSMIARLAGVSSGYVAARRNALGIAKNPAPQKKDDRHG